MTEPQPSPALTLEQQIAWDLGHKAGTDAVECIMRTLRLTGSPVTRLAASVFASADVLAIPLAIMMSRRDKSPEEVVDLLFGKMRAQLIGAVTDVRDAADSRAPETAPPQPTERTLSAHPRPHRSASHEAAQLRHACPPAGGI